MYATRRSKFWSNSPDPSLIAHAQSIDANLQICLHCHVHVYMCEKVQMWQKWPFLRWRWHKVVLPTSPCPVWNCMLINQGRRCPSCFLSIYRWEEQCIILGSMCPCARTKPTLWISPGAHWATATGWRRFASILGVRTPRVQSTSSMDRDFPERWVIRLGRRT